MSFCVWRMLLPSYFTISLHSIRTNFTKSLHYNVEYLFGSYNMYIKC